MYNTRAKDNRTINYDPIASLLKAISVMLVDYVIPVVDIFYKEDFKFELIYHNVKRSTKIKLCIGTMGNP